MVRGHGQAPVAGGDQARRLSGGARPADNVRLYHHPDSPYVRKAMVAAHECGLAGRLELVPTTPETVVADVRGDNPLAQIPTLILDDGTRLFDSFVIAEYFDSIAPAGLFPPPGPARWAALTRHALGHGIIDAAIARRHEARRPEYERSPAFDAKRRAEIARALDALEGEAGPLADAPDIGAIAIAVALGYLDLRFAAEPWREGRPALAAWYERFAARPAMRATAPPTP